jgi:hypothetical protein
MAWPNVSKRFPGGRGESKETTRRLVRIEIRTLYPAGTPGAHSPMYVDGTLSPRLGKDPPGGFLALRHCTDDSTAFDSFTTAFAANASCLFLTEVPHLSC